MHILVTADTVGGVWQYTRELVMGLIARGEKVTLVSFGEIPTEQQVAWMEGLTALDFRPTAFKLEWMQESEEDLHASAEYLKGIIAEVKPDLLHFSQYFYGSLECDLPRIVVAHSDVVSWWMAVHGTGPKDGQWIRQYRMSVSRGLAGANAVVAPSQWMLDQVRKHYLAPKMGSVIYNGRSPQLFNPHLSKDDFAVSVGRIWDFGKNAALLTRVASPVPVHLAGSTQNPDTVVTSAGTVQSSTSRLLFKGVLTEVQLQHLYARAAMYLATSRYEPFGLAPVEAALSRCAIVASDIPSFREIWGKAAFYFQNNSAQDLERALRELHRDPELRATYAKMAYDRARQRFTSDRMVDDYVGLYRTMVPMGVSA